MKNIEHFGDLTPRMNSFRENVLDKKPYICSERALLVTEAYKKNLNQPAVMKRALMLKNILDKMENNNLRSKGGALLPEEVNVYMETGFFGMEGKLNSGDAHLAVDYENVLKQGLKGYEQRVLKLKNELDLCVSENIDKYQFYKAVLIVIDAVKTYANRFSQLAKDMAEKANGQRKGELLEISRICAKLLERLFNQHGLFN